MTLSMTEILTYLYQYHINITSKFSSYSEALASEFLENFEELFPGCFMLDYIGSWIP